MTETTRPDDALRRRYMKALLGDLHAFERMLDEDVFESGVRRIGAEQEMFLVDASMQPAPVAEAVLARADDPQLVHELALFNVEANTRPRSFGGRCLSEMEDELTGLVRKADEAARHVHARVLLTGILPTLRKCDLGLDNMTPKPRYHDIDRATREARGGLFHVQIKGDDELQVSHDNVMLESCNTSFQVHFQVGPKEFAKLYNMAQAITGPVMAAAVNSPVLMGRVLWHETRVALFQHSVDARTELEMKRAARPRVSFGDAWVRSSPAEVYRENIARFRVLFVTEPEEDPMAVLDRGEIPRLTALCLHNGTVYRWNRVCYGTVGPHLRIENRVLPAGPTILDEVANAAFYYGLMSGCVEEYGHVRDRMEFEDARNNFFAAARLGLKAQMAWVDGEVMPAQRLILDKLLPLAHQGLERAGIDMADVERYLGVVRERVAHNHTGSQWVRSSLRSMGGDRSVDIRHRAITRGMLARGFDGKPVHEWTLAGLEELTEVDVWRDSYRTVGQFMSTDLFTVRPEDLVDLAANLMDWEHVRHVPVEDEKGRCVGLLSSRALLRLLARGQVPGESVSVADVMKRDPVTVAPSTPTLDAIALMRDRRVGCLPVVEDDRLVGIVTESDLIGVAARLLDEHLRGGS
ncbi:MAG: CBS domain-containing protein [Planctomycetes bacterium]|nr:CBS domain-containing protein [Planctomycetota bacterium]